MCRGRSRGSGSRQAGGAYIGAAYWFTASTSFANPAISVGRMFSDSFTGIAPSSAPVFIAALRAREMDPGAEVTVVVADACLNFSICGNSCYVSGEVTHWRNLAHRTIADLEAAGMALRLDTTAHRIDAGDRKLLVAGSRGEELISYDQLVIGTGAVPVRPRSPAWTRSAPPTGCTCSTRWTTPSPSCARWRQRRTAR